MLHASATFAALAATSQGSLSTLLKVEGMGSGYMLAGCVGAMEAVIQAKRGSYGMIWPCIIVYESFLDSRVGKKQARENCRQRTWSPPDSTMVHQWPMAKQVRAKRMRDKLKQWDPSGYSVSGRRSDIAGVVEWWCKAKERSSEINPNLVHVGKFPDLDVADAPRFRSFSHEHCD